MPLSPRVWSCCGLSRVCVVLTLPNCCLCFGTKRDHLAPSGRPQKATWRGAVTNWNELSRHQNQFALYWKWKSKRHSVLFFLSAEINFQLPDNYSFSLASAYGRLEQEMQCFFLIQWSFTLLHLHFQHLNKESKTVNDCFYFGFQLSWVLGNTNCTKYLGHWVGFWRDKSTKTLGTLCSKTKTLNNDWALKQKTRPTLLHQLTWSFVRCKINACIILLVRVPFNSILAALWLINLIMLTPTQLSLRWEISCMLSSYWRSLLLQIVGKLCNF